MTPRPCLVSGRPGLKFAVIYAETVHYHLGYLATPLRGILWARQRFAKVFESFDSGRFGWRRIPERLHLVKGRGALQSQPGRGPARPADLPVRLVTCGENFTTDRVLEFLTRGLCAQRHALVGRYQIECCPTSEDDSAGHIILQFTNISRPGMIDHRPHRAVRNRAYVFIHGDRELLHKMLNESRTIRVHLARRRRRTRKTMSTQLTSSP